MCIYIIALDGLSKPFHKILRLKRIKNHFLTSFVFRPSQPLDISLKKGLLNPEQISIIPLSNGLYFSAIVMQFGLQVLGMRSERHSGHRNLP